MQGLIGYGLIFRNAKQISTHSWHSLSLETLIYFFEAYVKANTAPIS